MATAMHYEALRKKRVLEKMRDAQERAAEKACNGDETDAKVSEKTETVDRDEMARVIYKDLHKQERRLRDNCLVMGALENYVDDEYISKKIREAQQLASNN